MNKHIYELVYAGLEHFIIIIYNKIQFHTFSLTHFWHTSGKMQILEQNFELIKLWQLCLAPTHLLYMSQFFKKKKLGFEPKPTHLFGQCHEICSLFFLTASLRSPNSKISYKTQFLPLLDTCEYLKTQKSPNKNFSFCHIMTCQWPQKSSTVSVYLAMT